MATQTFAGEPLAVADSATPLHYVDWGAILAGTILASAISTLLFAFGTGIGLSMVSPYEGEGVSKTAYFVALGLWTLWVVVSSFMAGGYVSGRMRRRTGDGDRHEVEVRDGVHGLSVWALGTVVASILFALGVSGAAVGVAKVAAPAAGEAAKSAANSPTVDALFRQVVQPQAQSAPAAADSMATGSPPPATPRNAEADRSEVGRLLGTNMVKGELNATDKTYVASLVAANTGMSQAEAERRVTEVVAEAKQKAEAARKIGILLAFATAVTLLVGGAAAAWAATLGGKHRDERTDTSHFWRWS
jgi:hypothetical protein